MYFLDLCRPVGLWAKKKLAQNYTLLLILLRLNQHFLRGCECFTAEDVALCPQRRPGRRSLGSLCTASAYDRRSTGDCSWHEEFLHASYWVCCPYQDNYTPTVQGAGMCRDVQGCNRDCWNLQMNCPDIWLSVQVIRFLLQTLHTNSTKETVQSRWGNHCS